MSDSHPSPWTIVNDYTKTVVTLSAAFLAFTATFSGQFFKASAGSPTLLLVCWAFLVVSIAAALFSGGRLTGYLEDNARGTRNCLLFANIAYFALFAAIVCFFVFAFLTTRHRSQNSESIQAVSAATQYLARVDSTAAKNARLRSIVWNENGQNWSIGYATATDTVTILVDPGAMRVVRFQR